MSKTWVMGDLHGNLLGLQQCLQRSNFSENDTLIQLGDVCDGGLPYVAECVDELLNIKNLIHIRGNHDDWFINWLQTGNHPDNWKQGGRATMESYLNRTDSKVKDIRESYYGYHSTLSNQDIEPAHETFFLSQKEYYIDKERNMLFVHGGFNRHINIDKQPSYVYWWDRDLWFSALSYKGMPSNEGGKYSFKMKDGWKHVFIGHTQTTNWNTDQPMTAANITNVDTGGGDKGRVTIMNVDDINEFYQSDKTLDNYPDFKGRR